MYWEAYGILKDRMLAEDAVQQAFIKVMKNLHKLDEKSCHKTTGYVVTIARNVSKSLYKQRKKKNEFSYEVYEKTLADKIDIMREGENEVIKSILELPEIYLSTMMLKYAHGFEDHEIAEQLVDLRVLINSSTKILLIHI